MTLATHGFGNSCRGTLCHWQLMPRNGRSSKYSLETDRVVWHQQIKNMINLLRQSTPPGQGSQLEPSESCPVGMVMATRWWKWIIYVGTFEGGPRRWFANGCEGATVHGMEMNHLSCQMARVMEWKWIIYPVLWLLLARSLRRWSWGYCYDQVH